MCNPLASCAQTVYSLRTVCIQFAYSLHTVCTQLVAGGTGDYHLDGKVGGHAILTAEGSMPKKKRNYKKEYASYHAKPVQRKRRSMRNQARKKMGLKVGDPREVDHRRPLSKGGGNGRRNLRVVSKTANRRRYNKKR